MGVSTDGILFFGFTLPEDFCLPGQEDHEDIEKFLADAVGGEYESWDGDGHLKRSKNLKWDYHCHSEAAIPYIAIADPSYRVHRGYEVEVDPAQMTPKPEWFEALAWASEALGLDKQEAEPCWRCAGTGKYGEEPCPKCKGTGKDPDWEPIDTKPRWLLVSYWG